MVSVKEREVLRGLAGRVGEWAGRPLMAARRRAVEGMNALRPERPMVLCFPEGAWGEILPGSVLECVDPVLRGFEWQLRAALYQVEVLRDDNIVLPYFDVNWVLDGGNFGVEVPREYGDNRGSFHWDPPIKDWARDFGKLRHRVPGVDRAETWRRVELAGEVFGDLLLPRIRCWGWWSVGLTQDLVYLVGLEELMLAMMDQPEQVHRYMAWLRDDYLAYLEWFEREGLLTPNADVTGQCGSGGLGLTRELAVNEGAGHRAVKLKDLWGLAESQETVGVSPGMFAEFVLPYQMPLMEKFGLVYYGCCEQLHQRMEEVLRAPRLRRVSVSPWADLEVMGEKLAGKGVIWCRKPNPSLVCVNFDEGAIRADLRASVRAAAGAGCPLEIILKDTHTVRGEGWRLSRWVEIAREEAGTVGG